VYSLLITSEPEVIPSQKASCGNSHFSVHLPVTEAQPGPSITKGNGAHQFFFLAFRTTYSGATVLIDEVNTNGINSSEPMDRSYYDHITGIGPEPVALPQRQNLLAEDVR